MFKIPQKKNTDLKRNYIGKDSIRKRTKPSVEKNKYQLTGLLIALFSCLASWVAIPELHSMIIPDKSSGAAGFPYPDFATNTAVPTSTLALIADTPDGTILKPGEMWAKNNILLILEHTNHKSNSESLCKTGFEFQIINMSTSDSMISISKEDFVLTDNHGREWKNLGVGTQADCPDINAPSLLIERVPSNNGKDSWVIWYSEDFESLGISEVTISVKEILSGVTAVWKVSIE